ncbi:MAG: hypothetical protein ACRBHB_00475 [Arenicella sp.]
MSKNYPLLIGLSCVVLLLSACSGSQKKISKDNSIDYHTAKQIPPLQVPAQANPDKDDSKNAKKVEDKEG